jgi:hypothetical protein
MTEFIKSKIRPAIGDWILANWNLGFGYWDLTNSVHPEWDTDCRD